MKTFQVNGDGDPILFFYDASQTRGISVAMKRDISKTYMFRGIIEEGRYFDIATPYGYGGWIIEGKGNEKLFSAYQWWLQKNDIISEFVRFHPMLKNHEKCTRFYEVTQLGEVVHMDLDSPELIWNNITSKNRNMIRKAIKNNVKIYNGRFPEIFDKFRVIYNTTMDKDNAEAYYYFKEPFYESIINDLPQNAQIFWAEKDGLIIATSIILGANGKMNYHLSGSLQEYGSLAPGNLILYTVALWGCANGYKTFYLGGGVGSGEDSLFKFKRSFYKGEINHFYIGKKTYNQNMSEELIAKRNEIENPGFFPQYRG